MMEEKEFIAKLRALNHIKPREQWVVFTKQRILAHQEVATSRATFAWFPSIQKHIAYGLAVLLLLVGGVFGFMKYAVHNQPAAVSMTQVKSDLEKFKTTSQDLAVVSKTDPKNIAVVANQVKNSARALTDAAKKDPQVAKEIALDINNNKTNLDVVGDTDLKAASDDLYKTIDEQMIADLDKTTLTDDQKEELKTIKDSFAKEDYSGTLVNILLLNHSTGKGN